MSCCLLVEISLSGPRLLGMDEDIESLLRVFFVSSDAPLAELFKLKLELDGYWVTVISTAKAALEEMGTATAPDIVYLDIRTLNEFEGMHDLSVNPLMEKIPIVVLSGKREHELAEAGVQLGILENLVRVNGSVPRDRGSLVGEKRLWAS